MPLFLTAWPWVFLGMPLAFLLFWWVGTKGDWRDAITIPPWLRDYARVDRNNWLWGAMGMAVFSLVLYLSYWMAQP